MKYAVPRTIRYAVRAAMVRTLAVAARGDRVTCPVCASTWSRFPRGLCPGCASASRHRLIALLVEDLRPTRILHVGAEPGLAAKLRGPGYVPCDLEPPRGFERVDVRNIDLPPGFDLVIASHVLEHIDDDRQAMREFHRVLAPGGVALLLVPLGEDPTYEDPTVTSPRERERHFGQDDHWRVYGPDISDRLTEAGFEVQEKHFARDHPDLAERHGLSLDDVVHWSVKPTSTVEDDTPPDQLAGRVQTP